MQKYLPTIPKVDKCCGCITDLKAAAAVIAVLAIVSSPMVSWAVVRHMYVVKVSCIVNTNSSNPDVVDIHMTNALSFGFGVSTGLGSSCLSQNGTKAGDMNRFIQFVRVTGWIVLIADGVFVFSSVNFLVKMFQGQDKQSSLIFIIAGFITIFLSFIYAMLYVSACVHLGGIFPVFEFFFAFFDLITWVTWLHLIVVMNAYRHLSLRVISANDNLILNYMHSVYQTIQDFIANNTCPFWSMDLLFNGGIFLQTINVNAVKMGAQDFIPIHKKMNV